jgi:hypothetical protein
MGDWVMKVLVVGFVAWLAWSFLRARYVFEVRVVGGQPSVRRGKVTAAFLARVAVVCRETGVARGWIGGVPHGRRAALKFSRDFPPGVQQRLRNEWALTG